MCGIIGEISAKYIDRAKFIGMRDTLIHRGPDDEGIYIDKNQNIALGHRRLSIIDLSPLGKQPMKNEDGTIWITFNGEIYNYKKLRKQLLENGHEFQSSTDTEVLIHGYEEWGIEILGKLNGMYSFGIWDENKNQLFIARDRLGIKPLYYYYNDKRFIFASEIKAIIYDKTIERIINPEAVKTYFIYGYIPAPHSIWKSINKLPPAHYLIYKNNKISIKKYWYLKKINSRTKENTAINQINNMLNESVKLRLISDVPVGVLLSGGLDSSLITKLSSQLQKDILSYTVGFKSKVYDEVEYAQILVDDLKIKNSKSILSPETFNSVLDDILYYYDEPLGSSSIFPTFLLMSSASKELKVALSGDGGDEVFAGYHHYDKFESLRKYDKLIPLFKLLLRIISKISKFFSNKLVRFFQSHLEFLTLNDLDKFQNVLYSFFKMDDLKEILNEDFFKKLDKQNFMQVYLKNGLKKLKDVQYLDINTFLVDQILVKVDRASMAHSMEVRVPFLDHNIVEYALSLNEDIIFKNKRKKYILKKIAQPILPTKIINRRKKGFSAPVNSLGFIQQNFHVLKNAESVKDGILSENFLKKIIKTKKKNLNINIWMIIYFEMWYRKWKND